MRLSRVVSAALILLLGGCRPIYPAEPYFAEFRNQQYGLDRGILIFEESERWKTSAKKSGFRIQGWTVAAGGLDCEKRLTQERPLHYRIDVELGVIEFGKVVKTNCFLRGRDSARFLIYPIITSRGFFDPGEIEGAEHFDVVFKPIIR